RMARPFAYVGGAVWSTRLPTGLRPRLSYLDSTDGLHRHAARAALRFRRSRPRDRGSNLALWPGNPGPLHRAGRLPDRAAAGPRRAAGHRGRADDRAEELLQGVPALRAGAEAPPQLGAPG